MYKVFVNDKLVKLIDDYSGYASDDHTLFLKYYAKDAVAFAVDLLIKNRTMKQLVVYHDNLDELWNGFKSLYECIHAGGGLVKNKDKNVLFIFKRGKWDLPKGKVSTGEETKETAIREVQEECGIDGLDVIRDLGTTYHIFEEGDHKVLKSTHWFEMTTDFNGNFKVDSREGIELAKWMDREEMQKAFENTYPSVIDVCNLSVSN